MGLVLRDGRPIYDGAVGWSDKESSIVFMMQLIPSRTDVAQKFPNVVYQALTDAPRVGTSH